MERWVFLGLQVLALSACANQQIHVDRKTSSSEVNQIQVAVDDAQKTGELPAIGIMVWNAGKTVYFQTQGKRAIQKIPAVQLQDQWHLGSDSKAMTAFLIGLAVQNKKFTYDSKVADLLGVGLHALNQDLKVNDLLTHGSGLKDVQEVQGGKLWKELFQSKDSLRVQRTKMATAALLEIPHMDPKDSTVPMRKFSYANVNYVILGAILEKTYNLDWEQLLTREVFVPLSMSSCGYGVPGDESELEPSQPWPHVIDNGKLIGISPKDKLDNPPMLGPAGTVHCSLVDWKKFIEELTVAWGGKGQLLTNKSVVSNYFINAKDSVYTAGGWGRIEGKYKSIVFSHDGSNTFNYASAFFSPGTNSGFLIVTNVAGTKAEAAITKLKKFLAQQF